MTEAEQQALKTETELVNANLRYDRDDTQERIHLQLPFGGGDFCYQHVVFHVIFDEDGTGAHVVSSPIVRVPADRFGSVLEVCNDAHKRFRWATFYVDDDSDLMLQCDAPLRENSVGDECIEVVMRLADILDDMYPDFMKVVWAS